MYNILGITGVARVGKDTLFTCIKEINKSSQFFRVAFADELKKECDEFLISNTGISAFTEDEAEKKIIRPFLVTYGTHVRRKLDKNCWIKKIEPIVSKDKDKCFVITDVRFPNEAEWIKKMGGIVIHLSRDGILPANDDEKINDPMLKNIADYSIKLPTFDENLIDRVKNEILNNQELQPI